MHEQAFSTFSSREIIFVERRGKRVRERNGEREGRKEKGKDPKGWFTPPCSKS